MKATSRARDRVDVGDAVAVVVLRVKNGRRLKVRPN
jgi:hypothetical protein